MCSVLYSVSCLCRSLEGAFSFFLLFFYNGYCLWRSLEVVFSLYDLCCLWRSLDYAFSCVRCLLSFEKSGSCVQFCTTFIVFGEDSNEGLFSFVRTLLYLEKPVRCVQLCTLLIVIVSTLGLPRKGVSVSEKTRTKVSSVL